MTPFGVSGIRTRVLCRGMEVVAVSAFCLPAMLRYHTRGCVSRKKSCERSGRKNFFSAESPGPARPRTPRQGIYPLHPDPAMGPVINNKLYPPVWQCRQVSSRAKENERNAAGKRLWAFPPAFHSFSGRVTRAAGDCVARPGAVVRVQRSGSGEELPGSGAWGLKKPPKSLIRRSAGSLEALAAALFRILR